MDANNNDINDTDLKINDENNDEINDGHNMNGNNDVQNNDVRNNDDETQMQDFDIDVVNQQQTTNSRLMTSSQISHGFDILNGGNVKTKKSKQRYHYEFRP